MIAAASLALVVGLTEGLSLPDCLILVMGAAVIAGGVIFTFLEVHRLALPAGAQVTQQEPPSAHRLSAFASLRRAMLPVAESTEACPHHEYYPESPGEDQGQLTSHWPSSTPSLRELLRACQKRSGN
jgi:hypothetical protein